MRSVIFALFACFVVSFYELQLGPFAIIYALCEDVMMKGSNAAEPQPNMIFDLATKLHERARKETRNDG